MKGKKKRLSSNGIKEIIMKCFIIFSGVFLVSGVIIGCYFGVIDKAKIGMAFLGSGLVLSAICVGIVFMIGNMLKDEGGRKKDFKIVKYECTLTILKERMKDLYEEVKNSRNNLKNYYSTYYKKNEVVIIAVMHVGELFNEDEFVNFMNEIPQVNEKILNHTLIVIFIEEEKSSYLYEIMNTAEYNSLWDTKIFSVYEVEKNILQVNRTKSGTGYKAYNDAIKELDKIFSFQKNELRN